jgi:hypothetical protein
VLFFANGQAAFRARRLLLSPDNSRGAFAIVCEQAGVYENALDDITANDNPQVMLPLILPTLLPNNPAAGCP